MQITHMLLKKRVGYGIQVGLLVVVAIFVVVPLLPNIGSAMRASLAAHTGLAFDDGTDAGNGDASNASMGGDGGNGSGGGADASAATADPTSETPGSQGGGGGDETQHSMSWELYCTGSDDPNGNYWQWWEKTTNADPIQYRYVRPGDGSCAPGTTWETYCTGGDDPNGNFWQWWEKTNGDMKNYRYIRSGDGLCVSDGSQDSSSSNTNTGTQTTFSESSGGYTKTYSSVSEDGQSSATVTTTSNIPMNSEVSVDTGVGSASVVVTSSSVSDGSQMIVSDQGGAVEEVSLVSNTVTASASGDSTSGESVSSRVNSRGEPVRMIRVSGSRDRRSDVSNTDGESSRVERTRNRYESPNGYRIGSFGNRSIRYRELAW